MSAGACLCAMVLATTAGWEDVNPDRVRNEFPVVRSLWRADWADHDSFAVSMREGAAGTVSFGAEGLCIEKTNDVGKIVVTAKPFAATRGTKVRFVSDVEIPSADVDFSSGFLRGYGREEDLSLDIGAESANFYLCGQHTVRGMPNTAPGMTTRKFAHLRVKDDVVTPAIVVCGARSTSVWKTWEAEDDAASQAEWKKHYETHRAKDHSSERIDEKAFDAMIAADAEHTARIARIDGVSRLLVDGRISAPALYKAKHILSDGLRHEMFAGRSLQGSDVKLMVKEIRLGGTDKCRGYWTPSGFDAEGAVREIKDTMRIAPDALFLVAIGCTAYPEFTAEHPEEVWRTADGMPLVGSIDSCLPGYGMMKDVKLQKWPWVSYSSRIWRDGVKKCIRLLTDELKRQGLSKRIVGVHIYGYHDEQFSFPYADHSEPAKREYARQIATGAMISTNYDFVCKQSSFTAQEEFARAFKQGLGKDSIAVLWCESPFGGVRTTCLAVHSFLHSDVIDAMVTQPSYRERRPGFPVTSPMPLDSLHLHGKMFLNEFDLRTYGALEAWAWTAPSVKSLGQSDDFAMWQTVYRKFAGEMDAGRMGYWFYDMGGGWFSPPEISADIRAVSAESRELAEQKPSPWKPSVAVIVDEAGYLDGSNALDRIVWQERYVHAWQLKFLSSGGAPFRHYHAEDVIDRPELLDGCKMAVFALMRRIDGRRQVMLDRLAARGMTLVFLTDTAKYGGANATGFEIVRIPGEHERQMVAEPGVGISFMSQLQTTVDRDYSIPGKPEVKGCGERCSVREMPGVRVLARYKCDGLPAFAMREDASQRRVFVCEPSGLTPEVYNWLAKRAGAYVAFDRPGVQLYMNGDFISIHCLRGGRYEMRLPFASAKVVNLRNGREEPVRGSILPLELTAGETCRFRLWKTGGADVRSDTWVATDGLGRTLPTFEDVGGVRTNRTVAMFYFLTHGQKPHMDCGPYDVEKILAADPDAMDKPTSPPWGPIWQHHYWSEPLFGYYRSTDKGVIRKHAQMLADAGVDAVAFDCSNGFLYPDAHRAVFEAFAEVRAAGGKTPQIFFVLPFLWEPKQKNEGQRMALVNLWNAVYKPGLHSDLWFRWEGKPLVLSYRSYAQLAPEPERKAIEGFFTFRGPHPTERHPATDYFGHWSWREIHPQSMYHAPDGTPEEMSVSVSQNSNGKRTVASTEPDCFTRAHCNGRDDPTPANLARGLNFQEQWERALEMDPPFVFVTGWNEWGAHFSLPNDYWKPTTKFMFVDNFDAARSRDAEPCRGLWGDAYYYQLAANVRRYKGVRKIPFVTSGPVRIDGKFDDWHAVGPSFLDTPGDPVDRDHPMVGKSGRRLTDRTGRNDIVEAKVSADAESVCFYVRTGGRLVAGAAENWMLLFVDADADASTGWMGYDLTVRPGAPDPDVKVAVGECEIELSVPLARFGGRLPRHFDFKWADNCLDERCWRDFTLHGDAAPNDRYNYRARFR